MKDLFRQKRRYAYLGHLCRRAVALVLALALVAPMTSAFAAPTDPDIVLPHPLEAGEEPTITIEANAVVNRWYDKAMGDPSDYLTGDLEVAIRVKSGEVNGTLQPFNTLGVALDYSPILTPYSWTLIDGIDLSGEDLSGMTAEDRVAYKTAAAQPVSLNGTKEFEEMTSMQTLKSKKITAAVAHVSGTTEKDAEGNITAVKDGHLYMMAQADRPVVLEKDTVLAVVTFKYDVENIKILASQAPDWYQWLVDTGTSTAAEGDEGDGTGGDGTGDTGGTTTGGVAPEDHWLVRLTTVADVNESYYGGREVRYDSEDNSMYHSATRQPLPAGWDNTTTPATQKTVDNYIELNKDVTKKVDHQVNFALVNQTTYNDGGLTLDDLATVLFYDWDDTLLGLVIVPKDGDARKIVNDYIGSHFIHPQLTTNTNYTSLARVDNYRGKYPTTAMSEEDAEKPANKATTVADGGEYALTNKLDYVFFKRPMERAKITVGTGTDAHEVDGWKQKSKAGSDGSEGDWDTEYPYLYGWAQVPDYRHPENVWTTLGMGELNSYSGSNLGGYVDIGVVPATVVPTDTNFKFADFDFRVRNSNSLTAGSIYAVKAVYEPGEGLRSGAFQYRMISEPYYNKLNAGAASNGGAYSVDITFERASVQVDNFVRGVARTREPYVRQDTTVDSLWMVNEDKNIDHDLPNVTNYVAYTSKAETTYTKVEVENSEEVFVSLTLSARQNKVDYYLKEGYGANFVVGDARTPNDYNRSTQESTLDNYNYFVEGQSDEFDTWFDAAYGEREGTQGFVFNGTLNQIMQKATQCINGEITVAEFNPFLTENVFKDINLRLKTGKAPETASEISTARNAVLAAAEAAKPSNNSGSTKYWDTVHNCAQLTYHELQGFIINDSLDHDESPIKDGSGKVLLNWCHLHKDCMDAVSTKPKNWADLIDKAKNSPDDIDGLTPNEIENLFHLRKDSAGTKYDNVADFKADIVRAVTGATNTSWDQIQANILKETLPTQVNERSYWWYNGAESVPLNSLADTVAAAQDAIKAVKLPDGTTMVRYDKLNQLKPAFEENKASPTVARSWNNATKNLCITKDGSEGEKFDTFADFRSAFVAAVTQAENNNITLTTTNSAEVYAYWQKLQYHILNKSYSTTILPEMNGYWWYDGMSKIGDLPSLLAAAQRQVEMDKAGAGAEDAVFKMFGVTDLYDKKLTELHFRSNFHGDQYTDLTAFKNAVKAFVQLPDSGVNVTIATSDSTDAQKTNSWNHLQYYLIHGGDSGFNPATIVSGSNSERVYYWWRKGADGEAYPLTANPTDAGIGTLMEAVYRHVANGNPKAYEQLDAAAAAAFRLVSDYNKDDSTVTNVDTLLAKWGYTDTTIGNLYTALDNLYGAIPAGTDYSTVTWRQIQHYLLKTEYKPADGTDYPSDKKEDENGYWWRDGKDKPSGSVVIKSDLEYLFDEIDKYLKNDPTADLDAAWDQYVFSGKLKLHGGTKRSHKFIETVTNNTQLTNARKALTALVTTLKNSGATTCVGTLDWYVLQYYTINDNASKYAAGNAIVDHDTALAYYLSDLKGSWVPTEYEASGAALMAMFAMVRDKGADTTIDVDPDTGITTVTTTVETELENGQTLVVETVVTIDPETNETETRTVTTLLDEEGNVLSSTETVTGQPEPPVESPVPTESETPAPSESVGADVPIGPETSPEPTESLGPDVSPSPEPSESPVPTESETPAPSESADPDASESPSPSPAPEETPAPTESEMPEPSEELPDPEVPKGETPDPTESPEPTDPAESDSSAGGDGSAEIDNSTDSGGTDAPVDPQGTSTLSARTLNSGPLAKREKQTNSWLSGLALNWGRSRPPASSGFMGSPRWTLPGLALDWRNILTIGRTHT